MLSVVPVVQRDADGVWEILRRISARVQDSLAEAGGVLEEAPLRHSDRSSPLHGKSMSRSATREVSALPYRWQRGALWW